MKGYLDDLNSYQSSTRKDSTSFSKVILQISKNAVFKSQKTAQQRDEGGAMKIYLIKQNVLDYIHFTNLYTRQNLLPNANRLPELDRVHFPIHVDPDGI